MTGSTVADLVDVAQTLASSLHDEAAAADTRSFLDRNTVLRLAEAGLLNLHQPARFGGQERTHEIAPAISDALARASGSLAWFQSTMATHAWLIGCFPVEAQEAVWGADEGALVATAFSSRPGSEVTAVPGGYRVRGEWEFSSGCHHAAWIVVNAIPEGESRPGLALLLPMNETRISGTWNPVGLRGTGSYNITVHEAFVPSRRAVDLLCLRGGPTLGSDAHGSSLYTAPLSSVFPFCVGIVGVSLGKVGVGAVHESILQRPQRREQPAVQSRYAEAEAMMAASTALIERVTEAICGAETLGSPLPSATRVMIKHHLAYAVRMAGDALGVIAPAAGAHGLNADSAFQRSRLDLQAVCSHAGLSWDTAAEQFARFAYGLDPTDPMLR